MCWWIISKKLSSTCCPQRHRSCRRLRKLLITILHSASMSAGGLAKITGKRWSIILWTKQKSNAITLRSRERHGHSSLLTSKTWRVNSPSRASSRSHAPRKWCIMQSSLLLSLWWRQCLKPRDWVWMADFTTAKMARSLSSLKYKKNLQPSNFKRGLLF